MPFTARMTKEDALALIAGTATRKTDGTVKRRMTRKLSSGEVVPAHLLD